MTPYDEDLQQLQGQITHLHSAAAKLTDLYQQRDQLRRQRQVLTDALAKEQGDVDRLEGMSLAALFYSFLGKKEEKLDQEKAEACAAAARLGTVTRQLTAVEQDITHYEGQQDNLSRCEARYHQLIQEKSDYLKGQNPTQGEAICRLEGQIAQLNSQLVEIREAIAAGEAAAAQTDAVQQELSSANRWGTFDLLGGGMISTAVKHSHLDTAQREIESLQTLLNRFHTELSDVTIYADIQAQTGEFLRFADYFFDGIFADWMVLNHIHDVQDQIGDVQNQLSELLKRLLAMSEDLTAQMDSLRQQLDALIQTA
jgi:chromosome segregation ATPase